MIEDILTEKAVDIAGKPPEFVSHEERISSVIGKMKKLGVYALPVREGGDFAGIITAEGIVYSSAPPTTTKAGNLIAHTPFLPEDASISEACDKMWRNDLRSIPVGSRKKFAGILTFWDILEWCLRQQEFKKLKVTEIGIRDMPVIRVSDEADRAKVQMRERRISKLMAEDEKIERLLGSKDYMETISKTPMESLTLGDRKGEKQKLRGIDAGSLARRIRVRAKEDDSIHDLLKKMKRKRSAYAFFVDYILTHKDVLRYLAELGPEKDLSERAGLVVKGGSDELMLEGLRSKLRNFIELYDKKFGRDSMRDFKITIKESRKKGKGTFFEMYAKLLTDSGDFCAEKKGWNFPGLSNDLIEAIRRQIWP